MGENVYPLPHEGGNCFDGGQLSVVVRLFPTLRRELLRRRPVERGGEATSHTKEGIGRDDESLTFEWSRMTNGHDRRAAATESSMGENPAP